MFRYHRLVAHIVLVGKIKCLIGQLKETQSEEKFLEEKHSEPDENHFEENHFEETVVEIVQKYGPVRKRGFITGIHIFESFFLRSDLSEKKALLFVSKCTSKFISCKRFLIT